MMGAAYIWSECEGRRGVMNAHGVGPGGDRRGDLC